MSHPNRIRLVAGLLLAGGLVAFFYMVRISGWERSADGTRFLMPDTGGKQYAKAEILPLLGQYGGIAIGLGVALLIIAQIYAARQKRAERDGVPFPKPAPKIGPLKTVLLMAMAITIGMVVTFGYRWYDYVTHAASPFDEVGIALNSRLPEPLRAWGCERLKERFSRTLPPHGCADGTGRAWR